MKILNKKMISLLLGCCIWQTQYAQKVWPGDVNNNGIANGVDLLYWGVAYGATGPARAETTSDWSEQNIPAPWPQSFPGGLNYLYADCNGDGIVNNQDEDDAIKDNYNKTHDGITPDAYLNGVPGQAPGLTLQPQFAEVNVGQEFHINVLLGDAQIPVQSIYGITFKVSFDADLIDDEEHLEFEETSSSWIDPGGLNSRVLKKRDPDTGKAEVAITRIDHQNAGPGGGKIGAFSIVIEDIIVGLSRDTFHMQIDSVLLIDKDLNMYPVAPDTVMVIVKKQTSAVSGNLLQTSNVELFPNPARQDCTIRAGIPLDGVQVCDALGRPANFMIEQEQDGAVWRLRWPKNARGVYLVRCYAGEAQLVKRLLILNEGP